MSCISLALAGSSSLSDAVALIGAPPLPGGGVFSGLLVGYVAARLLRRRGWSWTWGAVACGALYEWHIHAGGAPATVGLGAVVCTLLARRWHRHDLRAGEDLAQSARAASGPLHLALRLLRLAWRNPASVTGEGTLVGRDRHGAVVRVPLGGAGGPSHTLVLGATGSGKTVTQTALVARSISGGMAAVVIDPKGDRALRAGLAAAAAGAGRRFVEWSPEGPAIYNPFSRGSETEIADRLLSGERFTEPHYLRQAQRYLGHEVRVLRAAGVEPSLPSLVHYMDPLRLEVLARDVDEALAERCFAYLDALTARQQRDLTGARDRLAVVAESDVGQWLDPERGKWFDLLEMIRAGAVVLFNLDSDRRPLLASMLGAAVVQDLVGCVAALQPAPVPCVTCIDEFSAVSAEHVSRLFGRARSAGMSLVLGTQELSDLRLGRGQLLDQVLGNLGAVVAHRQVVPASADLLATLAGTRGGWAASIRPDGSATRRRVREPVLDAQQIASLPRGWAAVIVPAARRPVRLARVTPVAK